MVITKAARRPAATSTRMRLRWRPSLRAGGRRVKTLTWVRCLAEALLTTQQPYECHRPAPIRKPATRRFNRVSMRAYARVALVSMAVPASLGLAGCAAIEELRDAFLRWVESEKPRADPA